MRSHLITVGGGDHAQFGRGNPVVDAAIVEYLRTGRTEITSAPQAPITTPLPAKRNWRDTGRGIVGACAVLCGP